MEKIFKKVSIFGSGSFGTAMAYVISKKYKFINVFILCRNQQIMESINKSNKNCNYLHDKILPNNIYATTDPINALKDTDLIIHAIPIQYSLEYLEKLKDLIPENIPILNTSKGLDANLLLFMSELIPKALNRKQPMAFFSGPTFALELLNEVPTSAIIASNDKKLLEKLKILFTTDSLYIYISNDVKGIVIGGALKNIYAIAAGIIEGLDLGMNTLASLVTLCNIEMSLIAIQFGAEKKTIEGLSGTGDLILTCFGNLSRNRIFGKRLGKGESAELIIKSMKEVAEGVVTSQSLLKLANLHQIDAPIIKIITEIIKGNINPLEGIYRILNVNQIEINL